MESTSPNRPYPARRGGFTLVELLIVIGIIILLISILVPVVGRVRQASYNAAAKTFMTQLARAIDAYEIDFKAYPGPLANAEIYNDVANPLNTKLIVDPALPPTDFASAPWDTKKITMAENLVLGLLGGLKKEQAPPYTKLHYDPREVGNGAFGLNPAATSKRHKAYVEAINLSWRVTELPQDAPAAAGVKTGKYRDDAAAADDSIIPEFVDTYTDPLPILYLRAKRGAIANAALQLDFKNNTIVTWDPADATPPGRVGQYDLHQIMAYTKNGIGIGRKSLTHGLQTATPSATSPPSDKTGLQLWDAYPYFRNQTLSTPKESDTTAYGTGTNRNDVPHQKDGYILISAGPDRVYGTRDDITNFGDVGQ